MKNSKLTKVVSLFLFVVMMVSAFQVFASAAWDNVVYDSVTFGTNGYYNVISKKDYTLVPGAATETEMILNNSTNTRRQVLHIVEVDPSNPDISIIPGYYGIDKDVTNVANQQAAKITDMTAYYEDVLGYNVVAGMNTDLYYEANAPRVLVYNGVDMRSGRSTQSVLCVYQAADGKISCDIKPYNQSQITNELANGNAEKGALLHAVSVSFGMTVNNGELVRKTEERSSAAAARSMIGVKEDGTLVLVMNDGRSANNSVGFCDYELGESMLALGCKWAANCDGGGSSTFVSKRVGEEECVMRSVPCDGAERPTIHGIFIVSNVAPTGVLGSVEINSEYDYFAPGTTYTFGAEGIDTHGYAMDVPDEATWALSDESFGTVEDGVFVSNGTLGNVNVQVLVGGEIMGEKSIHVANPTVLNLSSTETTLPYSTPEKIRTITLPIVAKIGENEVYTDGAYDIQFTPQTAGVLNGLKFTATQDTSIAEAVISIQYLPTSQDFIYTVHFGKGSEVLWDFEDGDISGWVGTAEADQFMRDGGAPLTVSGSFSTPFRTMFSGGQISWSNTTSTALSSVANGGKAHGGDKALAVTFNMKNVEFNSWVYSIVWNINGNTVLRDVANGMNTTRFGCWMYVPKGFYTSKNNGAQSFQLQALKGTSSTATLSGLQLNMQYNGKNINALTEKDIPENRWIYVSADLTANNFVKLCDPLVDVYRSPSIFRMYVKPSEAQEMTYYFDDFTLDYSSAVDDRQPPVISNPTYCTNDTNIEFANQTLTTNVVSFDANVADYAASNAEGLDYNSAKIYVDGIAVDGVKALGNTMGVQNVVLSNGIHKITFEIADKLGNSTTLSKSITIAAADAKSAVRLAGHNDLGNDIESGSVYYVDIKADAIEDIDSVTTTVELQSAHEWELDHIVVADGFEASYSLNSVKDTIATVTITKTGDTTLTGNQTLASLPVRVWSFDENTLVGGDSSAAPSKMTASSRYASSYGEPVLLMEAQVLSGEVTYTDNVSGTFGGSISEATAVTGNKTKAWHAHDAELTVLNQAATCDEAGYSNRTYCETCGSVVDWGTTIPATGHTYVVTDGVLQCTVCGIAFNGVYEDGKTYVDGVVIADGWNDDSYYVDGVLQTGIVIIDDIAYDLGDGTTKELYTGYYPDEGGYRYYSLGSLLKGFATLPDGTHYFDDKTGYAPTEDFELGGRLYKVEGTQGKVLGAWGYTSQGKRYYYSLRYYQNRWIEVDGETYYVNNNGYAVTGRCVLSKLSEYIGAYEFDEDGKLIGPITGVVTSPDGKYMYYAENGVLAKNKLIKDGDDYYFARSNYYLITWSTTLTEEQTGGLLPAGEYTFGADGKLQLLNGPVADRFNESYLTFYQNGVRIYDEGLYEFEGDYYYVRSNGLLLTWSKYLTAEQMNNLFPAGEYTFGADGKLRLLNGPVADRFNESYLTFYQNGVRIYDEGLYEFDGNYYYVRNNGLLQTWGKNIADDKTNGLVAGGYYEFGTDGKMILP